MFKRVNVVGHGRVGSALAARLRLGGVTVDGASPELIVLCVPDRHIATVAAATATGPWIAHMSGAQPLSALHPHSRCFSVHPLQTFDGSGRPEQFDGAWAAVTATSDDARSRAFDLALALGLHPFPLADSQRAAYHAGAAIASNYLVTVYRAASALFDAVGAPPAALIPLMQRTIDNGFQLTGPIARGDWSTVNAHRTAIATYAPHLAKMYDVLAEATAP